jgi:DUF917 family protein
MYSLTWEEVDDILVGATIMGCGGGGELAEGRELMRRAYDEGRVLRLAHDLADVLLLLRARAATACTPSTSATRRSRW